MLKLHIYYHISQHVLIAIPLIQMVMLTVGCRPPSRSPSVPVDISVIIVPIGDLDPEDLEYLERELKARFGNCTVGNEVQMPAGAYNPQRGQYMSGVLLQRLSAARPDALTEAKVLGVTGADLYSPGLNFVFGQAQLGGQYAVISLKRLDPSFYGMAADRGLFRHRMLKEAVHELGHTLGLGHCSNRRCVMHFSNSLRDTDIKEDQFCKRCLARLGFDVQHQR
jgi:archaemetzincin